MKLSQILTDLHHIYDEFGDSDDAEMLDTYDMDMHQPITSVVFNADRQRVLFLSDR